jgi:hypothetical protein
MLLSEMGVKDLTNSGVTMTITTGLDALSRGNENDKINHWFSDISQMNNLPQHLMPWFNHDNYLKVTASGRDVDFGKVLFTSEQVAQNQAAQQNQQETAIAGQELAKKASPEQLAQAMQ